MIRKQLPDMGISEKRLLGIDYGEKRIGIAISDPLGMFAQPLVTLLNDNKFWENLKRTLEPYELAEIILGYPLKESGEKGRITPQIEIFSNTLKKRYKVPVILVDERYSSGIAKERILESVTSKKKRRDKGLIDKNAAAVILEDYMKTL